MTECGRCEIVIQDDGAWRREWRDECKRHGEEPTEESWHYYMMNAVRCRPCLVCQCDGDQPCSEARETNGQHCSGLHAADLHELEQFSDWDNDG